VEDFSECIGNERSMVNDTGNERERDDDADNDENAPMVDTVVLSHGGD
jgi:hypothetical protein